MKLPDDISPEGVVELLKELGQWFDSPNKSPTVMTSHGVPGLLLRAMARELQLTAEGRLDETFIGQNADRDEVDRPLADGEDIYWVRLDKHERVDAVVVEKHFKLPDLTDHLAAMRRSGPLRRVIARRVTVGHKLA